MSTLSAIHFFSKNIGITGFDPENAPFMACKELFDNSIDACAKARTEWEDIPKKINLYLEFENLELDHDARINIIVRDTGCGIPLESIDLLGTLFGTNKRVNKRDSYYTGQFGVGLKMILLYAAQHGDENLRIQMRMGNKIWKFKLLCDLKNGSFYVGNSESFEYEDWEWVTEFSVSIKLSLDLNYLQEKFFSMELYAKACTLKVKSYVALSKLWNNDISISFETNLNKYINDWLDGDINLSFESIFRDNFFQISSNKNSRYKIDSVLGFIQDKKIIKEKIQVKDEFYDVSEPNENNNERGSESEFYNDTQIPSLIPGCIYVYRFSNGMPIISKDIESCDIITSIKNFIKKKGSNYGMKLAKKGEINIEYPEEVSVFNKSEFQIPILVVPSVKYKTRLLFINIRGHEIQYGTLWKSNLKSNAGLSTSIQQSLKLLMKKSQIRFPSELMNIKEFALKSSVEKYCPIIARNLASMVIRSDSIIFKKGILEIFSNCDYENSLKYEQLLESKDEEQLREILDLSLSRWFINKNKLGVELKRNSNNFEYDSDEYLVEKEDNDYEVDEKDISFNGLCF